MDTSVSNSGVIRLRTSHSVHETLDRLEQLLKQRGVMIFARIDFSGDAARAGLTMPAQQLLIFGNPKAGTPLMLAEPVVGLDLPLKALVWQRDDAVYVAYNDPSYVLHRYGMASSFAPNLAAVQPLIELAASAAPIGQ